MLRDHYLVLGVSRKADLNRIKGAYREVAKQYHPDVARGADNADKFREIREAYEALSDERKRQRYDEELARRACGKTSSARSALAAAGYDRKERFP